MTFSFLQYGNPTNDSRPGGALTEVPFTSATGNTTLRLIADNSTTFALAELVGVNCSSLLSMNQSINVVYDASNNSAVPEQAIQYYRASTIVLTLDGYNDTDALQANSSTDVPIPDWVNQTMLQCVNETIGAATPLIDAGISKFNFVNTGFIFVVWIVGYLLNAIL